MFTYLRKTWRLNANVLICYYLKYFRWKSVQQHNIFCCGIEMKNAEVFNFTGIGSNYWNFGMVIHPSKEHTISEPIAKTGFLNYIGSRVNLGCAIHCINILFSIALTCNPSLVSSLKCVFFSLYDLANKQVPTWQGFILQKASLWNWIDSNGGHGEYSPLDTENTDRSGNVSRPSFILKPEGQFRVDLWLRLSRI